MSVDLILWTLLVLTVLAHLIASASGFQQPPVTAKQVGVPALVTLALVGVVNIVAWVWLAALTGYWQLAAMAVGGFLLRFAANSGRKVR